MDGAIVWDALSFVCEKFGITDLEMLVQQLCAIRDHKRKAAENG